MPLPYYLGSGLPRVGVNTNQQDGLATPEASPQIPQSGLLLTPEQMIFQQSKYPLYNDDLTVAGYNSYPPLPEDQLMQPKQTQSMEYNHSPQQMLPQPRHPMQAQQSQSTMFSKDLTGEPLLVDYIGPQLWTPQQPKRSGETDLETPKQPTQPTTQRLHVDSAAAPEISDLTGGESPQHQPPPIAHAHPLNQGQAPQHAFNALPPTQGFNMGGHPQHAFNALPPTQDFNMGGHPQHAFNVMTPTQMVNMGHSPQHDINNLTLGQISNRGHAPQYVINAMSPGQTFNIGHALQYPVNAPPPGHLLSQGHSLQHASSVPLPGPQLKSKPRPKRFLPKDAPWTDDGIKALMDGFNQMRLTHPDLNYLPDRKRGNFLPFWNLVTQHIWDRVERNYRPGHAKQKWIEVKADHRTQSFGKST